MSNLGSGEILVVLLLALLVLGPERLPKAARQIGSFVRQVRNMSSGFQDEIRSAMNTADEPPRSEAARIRPVPDPDPTIVDHGATSLSADDTFETEVRARNGNPAQPDGVADPPADERAAG